MGTDFLQPIARDEFVSLWQGMNAVPNPLLRRDGLGGGIENILSPDMHCVVVLCQLGNDNTKFISGSTAACPNWFILQLP